MLGKGVSGWAQSCVFVLGEELEAETGLSAQPQTHWEKSKRSGKTLLETTMKIGLRSLMRRIPTLHLSKEMELRVWQAETEMMESRWAVILLLPSSTRPEASKVPPAKFHRFERVRSQGLVTAYRYLQASANSTLCANHDKEWAQPCLVSEKP